MEAKGSRFDVEGSNINKILLVSLSAFATGLAWRMRGESGFGGMSGMLIPATILTLLIFFIWGDEQSISPALIGTMILLMAVTANGWGTINGQITGVLRAAERTVPYYIAGYDIRVNPLSGIFAMFLVGFGWVPLWAVIVGLLFSKKSHNFKHFIKIGLCYAIFRYLGELIFCHLIIPFIAPRAFDLFVDGLLAEGYDMIPWEAYLFHFKDGIWYRGIAGGRNYAAMVSNLASGIGAVGAWAYMKFKQKDNVASAIMMKINLIFGFAITAADIFIFINFGGLWRESIPNPPEWLPGWTMWEYATGFIAGGLTILMLFGYSKRFGGSGIRSDKESEPMTLNNEFMQWRHPNLYTFTVIFLGLFVYGFCSGMSLRLEKMGATGIVPYIPYILVLPGLFLYWLFASGKLSMSRVPKKVQCLLGILITVLVWEFVFLFVRVPIPISEWIGSMQPMMLVSSVVSVSSIFLIIKKNKPKTVHQEGLGR